MGTSGSYGGSGGQSWDRARTLLDELSPDDGANAGNAGDATSGEDGQDDVGALATALADALASEDNQLSTPQEYALGALLPRRGTTGGGAGGGGGSGAPGGVRGESAAVGRTGSSSRRRVARDAARGGMAIGGAFALRANDAGALAEIGLDLDALQALGPRAQCAQILDAVLGEGGHPDEAALRMAAIEQLKAIVTQETAPSEGEALRGFVAAYVFQLSLVELRSSLAKGELDAATAARKEGRLRRYIEMRVGQLEMPTTGLLGIGDFGSLAARLASETIRILRAQ